MDLPPITSSQNRQLQQVRRLIAKPRECRKDGLLVADGIHLVQEALKARLHCRALFVTVVDRSPEILAIVRDAEQRRLPVYRVLDHLFRSFSPVETPEGVVGVFERPAPQRGALFGNGRGSAIGHLVVAHRLQDPSNVGALVRSALGAGMRGLVTTSGTVDPFHHRALRASMGAAFHLPIQTEQPVGPLLAFLRNVGYRTVALSPGAETEISQLDPEPPTAIFLGAEGAGLDPAVESAVDLRVRIPMDTALESLGVAAAGAVAFFWLRLAGRNGRGPHP
jgi:RNA methyltransferase, TrmH family